MGGVSQTTATRQRPAFLRRRYYCSRYVSRPAGVEHCYRCKGASSLDRGWLMVRSSSQWLNVIADRRILVRRKRPVPDTESTPQCGIGGGRYGLKLVRFMIGARSCIGRQFVAALPGVHAESGGVVVSTSVATLRALPATTLRMRLLAIDSNDSKRAIGEYTFHHTPHKATERPT